MQPALADTADFYRIDATQKLNPQARSRLSQYMTPAPIARFMASLFNDVSGDLRVLDPGSGVGSLTAALIERCVRKASQTYSAALHCYEIDHALAGYLEMTLEAARKCGEATGVNITGHIHVQDFIQAAENANRDVRMLPFVSEVGKPFTHVIMNPPYKKIHSADPHRAVLRRAGLETSNLYTGFLYLAALCLKPGGEMVAIVPRSFCNGPYFRDFREKFLAIMALRHVHVFARRDQAFKSDDVLQENIILHAVRNQTPSNVRISTSQNAQFHYDAATGICVTSDLTLHVTEHSRVVRGADQVLHLQCNDLEQAVADRMAQFRTPLSDLGIQVSAGPVVGFRMRGELRTRPEPNAAPMLYPAHFRGGRLKWPRTRKPNAIAVNAKNRKWLFANVGHFVVARRFSSKEERRRIVTTVYSSDLPGELVGFENHLNVFHVDRKGFAGALAHGLCVYLNSSLVDQYFRQFSGHTQVNATDLRTLRYPDRSALKRLGTKAQGAELSQELVDELVAEEIGSMAENGNPLLAQQKIDDALEILRAIGMPSGQLNDRSALTLLALVGLTPAGLWADAKCLLMGITPIMDFCREQYGRQYAPSTRETFRRQTMHQFVEASIARYNLDDADRPVNSPKACYQVRQPVLAVVRAFGTSDWQRKLAAFLEVQGTLARKWARRRQMQMIPVDIPGGERIHLVPGLQSELIKHIITEFAPRFAPKADVIYIGDIGENMDYSQQQRLQDIGVIMDKHGKMPDVALYFGEKRRLLLVESVTSHGPINAKRHNELVALFAAAHCGIVYVTAFPDRGTMAKYLSVISWETEVWCADAPSHLIHFDGERFWGPYNVK